MANNEKLAIGIKDEDNVLYRFIPPTASDSNVGGVKASPKTTQTQEVKIDPTTNRLYVDDIANIAGDLTNLHTTDKQNLVSAINEVNDSQISIKEDLEDINVWNSGDINYRFDISEKLSEYMSRYSDSAETEKFIFFTDHHLHQKHDEDLQTTKKFITYMQKVYNSTPAKFVFCGGDWIGHDDSPEQAKSKFGYIVGYMKSMFKECYFMLGNHDTNYQGVDSDGNHALTPDGHPTGYRGMMLSNEVQSSIWFNSNGKTYYKFHGDNTTFYVFDTGVDWGIYDWSPLEMTTYKWEQIDWFATSLLQSSDKHIAIATHMWWYTENTLCEISSNIQKVAIAFNNREILSLNGKNYDFSNSIGRIEFVIAGHLHEDTTGVVDSGIPVIVTRWFRANNMPNFDAIFVDYNNRTLSCTRYGSGENRIFSLQSGILLDEDKRYNLLDFGKWVSKLNTATNYGINNGEKEVSGNKIKLTSTANDCFTNQNSLVCLNVKVKPNTKYTMSWEHEPVEPNTSGLVYAFLNGSASSGNAFSSSFVNKKLTFTTKSDTDFITFRLGVSKAAQTITYYNLQIAEGDYTQPYMPYF